MSFPTSPVNNQTAIVNGITYVYNSANNAWARVTANNITVSGNITANSLFAVSGTLSTSVTTGALVVVGGVGISGSLYIGNTGDVSANLGAFQTFSNSNASTQATSINTINANLGAFQIYANANLGTATTNITTLFSNASTQATSINTINANLGAFQTFSNSNASTQATSINTINANLGAFQTFSNSNASTQATSINTINANIGAFITYANTKIGTNTNSNLVVQATTATTSTSTGAIVVAGGVGIAGNVYADKLYTTNGVYWSGNGQAFTSTTIANTNEITANLSSGQNVGLNLTTTGVVAGNYGSATSIPTIVVDNKGRISSVTSNAVSTTITLAGGSGSGSVAGGGTLTVNGTSNQITTSVAASTVTIAFAQDITAPGNLTVAGNLTVQGNTLTIGSNNLTVVDSIIDLHTFANLQPLISDDGRDIGIRMHYYKGSDTHAFLGWENNTQTLIYLQQAAETNSNISGTYGNVQFGSLLLSNIASSTSTTTGALVIAGGAGIAGDIVLGGAMVPGTDNTGFIGNATNTWANGQFTNLTIDSTLNVRAAIDLADSDILRFGSSDDWEFFHDGTDNFIDLNVGDLRIRDNVTQRASFSRTTGNLVLDSSTASTSATTGALVVAGGVGIAGNVYIGATANQSVLLTAFPEWAANSARQTTRFVTSTTAPAGPIVGDQWYDSSTDIVYEYINDGTNSIWVDISSAFSNNFVTLSGVTVRATGNTQATSTTTGDLQVAGGVSIATGNLYIGGSGGNAIVATGNIIPSSNLSIQNNLGSQTLWWNNFYGVSTQARYADLAENYLSDANYSFGTVVCFGGKQEITISTITHDPTVAGVISENPAHLMNGALTGQFVLPLALQGRVYCTVKGPIAKGDLLVTSDIPGAACKLDKTKFDYGCLIGKSLENILDTSIKLIEVVVGRD